VLEVALATLAYALVTWLFFPQLRDRSRAFYQELLVNGLSPDRAGAGWYLRHGELPAWARDTYAGGPYAAFVRDFSAKWTAVARAANIVAG
jgi:hypothetical protein